MRYTTQKVKGLTTKELRALKKIVDIEVNKRSNKNYSNFNGVEKVNQRLNKAMREVNQAIRI